MPGCESSRRRWRLRICVSAAPGPTAPISPIRTTRSPAPPAGFNGVLTRQQWRGVVDFSQSVDAAIVTSFAVSPGVRDAAGAWKPDQAGRPSDLYPLDRRPHRSRRIHERTGPSPRWAAHRPGYDATAYGRDFRSFHSFMKQAAPETMILGPGTVGDAANGVRSARRLRARTGCGFVPLLRGPVGAMQRQEHAGRRPFPRPGSRARIGPSPSIKLFETNSNPASRSGSPKPRMPHAAETRGP